MLNLLKDYISESLPEGTFTTNRNLVQKVDLNGNFLEYYGNTLVFLLDDTLIMRLGDIQGRLYAAAPQMLAQPIEPTTFHMTLHDLVNGRKNTIDLLRRMHQVKAEVLPLLGKWRSDAPLRLRGTWLFNMVNTSIVLGLEPCDQKTATRLDEMYACLESIVPLGVCAYTAYYPWLFSTRHL